MTESTLNDGKYLERQKVPGKTESTCKDRKYLESRVHIVLPPPGLAALARRVSLEKNHKFIKKNLINHIEVISEYFVTFFSLFLVNLGAAVITPITCNDT